METTIVVSPEVGRAMFGCTCDIKIVPFCQGKPSITWLVVPEWGDDGAGRPDVTIVSYGDDLPVGYRGYKYVHGVLVLGEGVPVVGLDDEFTYPCVIVNRGVRAFAPAFNEDATDITDALGGQPIKPNDIAYPVTVKEE